MSATSSSIYSHRPMQPIRGSALSSSLTSAQSPGGGHLPLGGQSTSLSFLSGGGNVNPAVATLPVVAAGAITRAASRSNSRGPFSISDALDVIRREYDNVAGHISGMHTERREMELKLESQLQEMNILRQALYELEAKHARVKQQYEDELMRLRVELNSIRHVRNESSQTGIGALAVSTRPSPVAHPNVLSPRTSASMGAPPVQRSPDRQQRQLSGTHFMPRDQVDGDHDRPALRERGTERERDARVRAEQGREGGGGGRVARVPSYKDDRDERDGDRLMDGRDPKRRKADYPTSSSGTGSDYLPAGRQPQPQPQPAPQRSISYSSSAHQMEEFNPQAVPQEYKREGYDWSATYNPKAKRALDVSLVHAFPHNTVVCCVQFSADGRFLATGCNRTAQIFNVRTGEIICVLEDSPVSNPGGPPVDQGDLYIRSVRFSPDGVFLATGAEDKKIRVWEIDSRKIKHVFSGHDQEIYSLDFSKDGRFIVSGSGDKTMRVWDLSNAAAHRTIEVEDEEMDEDRNVRDSGVTSVDISPDGFWIAAGSLDHSVRVWDLRSGKLAEKLRGHEDSVYSVTFTPGGKGLVTGSLDKVLKYWDISHIVELEEGELEKRIPFVYPPTQALRSFVGHRDFVLSVAVSSDGQWVVSGSKDRSVHVWDLESGVLQFVLQGHKNSVISIDINSKSNVFATGSGDNSARIWSYTPIGI